MVSPAWTPDGQHIVVSKSRAPDPGTFWLFMYHRDGGTGVRVSAAPLPSRVPMRRGRRRRRHNRMGATYRPTAASYYTQRTAPSLQRAVPAVADSTATIRETGDVADHQRARQRHPARALARRQMDGVSARVTRRRPGLRVRNLETGAERWLAYPVTRDDQESRASRDTLPRYDFMPDGKSLIVPVNGKLQRIDFASGEPTPIPFTAKVQAEIAPRVYTVRVDDGDNVRALDPVAIAVSRMAQARVQRDESPLHSGHAQGRHLSLHCRPAAVR